MTNPDVSDNNDVAEASGSKGWLYEHRYPMALLVLFMVGGMVLAPLVFPGVHWIRSVIGGALFGVFCSFCVALPRFLE